VSGAPVRRSTLIYPELRQGSLQPTCNAPYSKIVVGGKWKVTLKVHPVVQDSYDFDRCFRGHPVHQEVASAPTMSCNVDRAKTWHDLISSLGACNIWTFGKFANRLNERLLIDTRLLRAKFSVVHLTMFAKSSSATAPRRTRHFRSAIGGLTRRPWK
jgi:hypothetical protein